MKKVLFLLVCVFALFALTACQFELPEFVDGIIGNDTTNDENNDDNQENEENQDNQTEELEHEHEYTWTVQQDADCTIAVLEVPLDEASRFGIMVTDETGKITEFQEKPKNPTSTKASMGIYIFNAKVLEKYLIDDWQENALRMKKRGAGEVEKWLRKRKKL